MYMDKAQIWSYTNCKLFGNRLYNNKLTKSRLPNSQRTIL